MFVSNLVLIKNSHSMSWSGLHGYNSGEAALAALPITTLYKSQFSAITAYCQIVNSVQHFVISLLDFNAAV